MLKGFKNILIYMFFPTIFTIIFIQDVYSKKYMYLMLISYVILTIYFIIKYKKELHKYYKEFNIKKLIPTIFYWIIGFALMMLSNYIINYLILPNNISNNELGNRELLYNYKFLYSIMICIFIPFLEEISFRLEFKKNSKNKYIFLLTSSIMFALLHILSTQKLIELLYFIPYFILGITFSYIYEKTDNIISSILSHIIHNTIIVLILLLF